MIEAIADPNYRDAYLQAINANLGCRRLVEDQFNPFAFEGDDRRRKLAEHDLPAEPDELMHPNLHRFWCELFSVSTEYVCADLGYSPVPPERRFPPAKRGARRSRQQSSGNWSGASLIARDGRMFTDVMAKWKVPFIKVPDDMDPRDEYKNSSWVGLDGQRAYVNSTLPQIGTEHSINKGGVEAPPAAAVWFQWWPMDEMLVPDTALSVKPEDHVYCWLTAVSYTRVRCIIKVVSNPGKGKPIHRLMRFYADAPLIKFSPPEIPEYAPKISGATAEWITEAPTSKAKQKILPLPDFGTVTFQDFYAYSAYRPGGETRVEPLVGLALTQAYVIENDRRVTVSRVEQPKETPDGLILATEYTGRRQAPPPSLGAS